MANGDTKTNQYLDIAANGSRADLPSDTCCETRTQTLIRGVAERVMDVEDEVERLENNPDVADIVATYADLQAYDTSQLTDKDVIRVLQDETRDGDSTYYRWSTDTNTWTYIGESKQYTDFVGTDGTTAGEAGLVPAPATTDAGKFLKADGTWAEASGGGGGGATLLTSADYNYPSSNPNGLAPWLLEPGLYYTAESMNIYNDSGSSSSSANNAFYVAKDWIGAKAIFRLFNNSNLTYTSYTSTGSVNVSSTILDNRKIKQTTGQSTNDIMSQKAVTDAISALEARIAALEGN